jgi:hypothetical protein
MMIVFAFLRLAWNSSYAASSASRSVVWVNSGLGVENPVAMISAA